MSVQIATMEIEGGRPASTQRMLPGARAHGWGAVFALTLCVATLIASEFMPVSLLTRIATDLRITEGRVGQAIAVSGIFAVLTSLGISPATRGIDRRRVLLWLAVLMGCRARWWRSRRTPPSSWRGVRCSGSSSVASG